MSILLPIPFDVEEFLAELDELTEIAYANKPDIKEKVAQIVTTYKMKD